MPYGVIGQIWTSVFFVDEAIRFEPRVKANIFWYQSKMCLKATQAATVKGMDSYLQL